MIVYSRDADADRAFFRDVLEYPHVDAGGGWLIFNQREPDSRQRLLAAETPIYLRIRRNCART